MGKKICAQTKTEDRKIRFVYNLTQLVNLLGGEELCLVRDDNVIVFSRKMTSASRKSPTRLLMIEAPSRSSMLGLISQTRMPNSS